MPTQSTKIENITSYITETSKTSTKTTKIPVIIPTSKPTSKEAEKTTKTTSKTTPLIKITKPQITTKITQKTTPKTIPTPKLTKPTTKVVRKPTQLPKLTPKTPILTKPTVRKLTTRMAVVTKKMAETNDVQHNEVIKITNIIPKTTVLVEDFTHNTIPLETDYLGTEKSYVELENSQQMLKHNKDGSTKVVVSAVGSLLFAVLAIVGVLFFLRRYGILGGFRGLGTTRSNSMSDVRFLASDEMLDFTLRCPDE